MMIYYIFFMMFITFISIFILFINMIMSMMKKNNYEKNLPFECGYSPLSKANLPFSLPFFLITLMFLIFDIEIVLLIPLILYLMNNNFLMLFVIMMTFIILLILTLSIEWFFNFLKWLY
uniref:NADH-ubiquinone oxidoreductase chain 3 n=1 Tax=Xylocopa appendiculata TaxID=135683 RepID=A0A343DRE6_9HYME|nr:NADH dehydrogenase subunit 3 [Xylocopa appendiculata]